MSEKQQLLPSSEPPPSANPPSRSHHAPAPAHRVSPLKLLLFIFCWIFIITLIARPFLGYHSDEEYLDSVIASRCPQVRPLNPHRSTAQLEETFKEISSSKYRNRSIDALSGAVKIPTVSYDDMGPVEGDDKDERWDIYNNFAAYLKHIFPLAHKEMKAETVNEHGLLFTWQGSDGKLKPTVLMAHYDVVPVAPSTADSWTHPPFSGYYDGKYIWGRGSSDDKNNVIAQLESIEMLISAGFKPRRTIILSFGFDEEIGGPRGAKYLGAFLEDRYGKDSVAVIVDEGPGSRESWGTHFSAPGTGEKGYADVLVNVRMKGGHSSVPPPHTAIGVVSQLVVLNEANPYSPRLHKNNPYLGFLYCGAAHSPKFPKVLRHLLRDRLRKELKGTKEPVNADLPDPLAEEAAKHDTFVKFLMTTAVAADVVTGGVKANALPEDVKLTLNHRINIGSSIADVKRVQESHARAVAKFHNLTVYAFTEPPEHETNCIVLSLSNAFEPAHPTPLDIDGVTPYGVLSGTTKALIDGEVIVSPGLMTGGTDTKHYWNLTKHIFRFNPSRGVMEMGNIHTVDEYIDADMHIYAVKWYWTFLRNMDEAEIH